MQYNTTRAVLNGEKKKLFRNMVSCSSYVPPLLVAIGGWRLVAVGGGWRLVAVGG